MHEVSLIPELWKFATNPLHHEMLEPRFRHLPLHQLEPQHVGPFEADLGIQL